MSAEERAPGMVLTMDIGNTRTKMAAFRDGEMAYTWRLSSHQLNGELLRAFESMPRDLAWHVGWMSVAAHQNLPEYPAWESFPGDVRFTHIHAQMPLPIENVYETPETLGVDRIVAVVAAKQLFPEVPVLIIDAGTALTYDFADAQGRYLGGGISPGIVMRFRALHTFTAKLPLIEEINQIKLVGSSTRESIASGVLNGILAEIEGICARYRAEYGPQLKVCLTGGDMSFFENHLKSANFADANLTLKGIHHILTYNIKV